MLLDKDREKERDGGDGGTYGDLSGRDEGWPASMTGPTLIVRDMQKYVHIVNNAHNESKL